MITDIKISSPPISIYMIVFLASIFLTVAQAQDKPTDKKRIEVTMSIGYHRENFSWSIAGNSINILSELKWHNLEGPYTHAGIQWGPWKWLVLEANFSRTFIASGVSTDTDYDSANRTHAVFDEKFNSDKGSLTSFSFMGGYTFFKSRKWNFTPAMGYQASRQSLLILDGNNNLANELHTTYKTWWSGLVFSIKCQYGLTPKLFLIPSIRYQQLTYYGKANWNLIQDFQHPVSFTHSAKGYCIEPGLQFRYALSESWFILLSGYFNYWNTGKGIDKLYKTNGEVEYTLLNRVNRRGDGFNLGISKSF